MAEEIKKVFEAARTAELVEAGIEWARVVIETNGERPIGSLGRIDTARVICTLFAERDQWKHDYGELRTAFNALQREGEADKARIAEAPNGWRFFSADASIEGRCSVMLERDVAGKRWWHSLEGTVREATPLYAQGVADTFPEAFQRAVEDALLHPGLARAEKPKHDRYCEWQRIDPDERSDAGEAGFECKCAQRREQPKEAE
jgi:hypothetical protein